ncbi:major type 1 subunit fimbrin (pilin) [Serratia fonticola]|jgi:major type 1 subunit fimbrin (pilin)|uniref:Major type 1 subunit fimbrin (Pilin) n=1 Tax=Serratia fonticola TaxID=47917 RepID=A0A559T433_SERFO|nr:fimbrial protein [Serratia fonticola]TQI78138.1 major type 1 subunit fimbrin (pilin) [Serratia fonticola]TQI94864.1 major type 1 subunit fimbrin (pilin) [Serratia fonticola]TVZ69362.1 major type 1 subunit fimbrin (pilin) [Serratia fonticola]
MIKKASVHALIALSSLLASVTVSYAAPVTDGTIQFNGKVVDAGCAVATGSIDQTIDMGQVSTTILKVAGDTSNTTDIPIVLEDCDTDTSKVVQVIFSGASVPGDTTVLAVGSDINAATNVGIKLYDSQNTEINLEELTPAVTLSPGENTLHFTAKYYALGKSTAGEANSTATFTMIYP